MNRRRFFDSIAAILTSIPFLRRPAPASTRPTFKFTRLIGLTPDEPRFIVTCGCRLKKIRIYDLQFTPNEFGDFTKVSLLRTFEINEKYAAGQPIFVDFCGLPTTAFANVYIEDL